MTSAHADEGGIWSNGRGRITLANLTIIAIAAFDGLAVIAALPSIAEDLGDVALLPWVATAYLGSSAVAVIIAGPVIDAIGVRRTFRASGLWFLVTSAAVAVAPNLGLLLAARVLQGLGGGLVIAVAIASVGLAYPHRLRPQAFAANNAVWGVMGFGGPALAAGMLAIHGWRLIFISQLPLTAIALAVGWNVLPSTRERPARIRTDIVGVGQLTVATFCVIVSLSQIGSNSVVALTSGAVAISAFGLYWRHAEHHDDPVVRRSHITRFPLGWVHLSVALVLASGLAADNYLPLYVQAVRNQSEGFAAFSVVFLTVGWTVSALIYARLLSHRPEPHALLLGAILLVPALGSAGIAIVLSAPLPFIFAAFFATGMAIGMVVTPGLTFIQGSSEAHEMGRVNAAHQYINTLAISCGVALGGSVLLFVVDRQAGDVEAVRDVLSGDDAAFGLTIRNAIADGMFWVIATAAVLGMACLMSAAQLYRRSPAR